MSIDIEDVVVEEFAGRVLEKLDPKYLGMKKPTTISQLCGCVHGGLTFAVTAALTSVKINDETEKQWMVIEGIARELRAHLYRMIAKQYPQSDLHRAISEIEEKWN